MNNKWKFIRTVCLLSLIILSNLYLFSKSNTDPIYLSGPATSMNDSINNYLYNVWRDTLPDEQKYRSIDFENISTIPYSKRNFVKVLFCYNTDTISIDDDIITFSNLESIHLKNVTISKISSKLFDLQHLKRLSFYSLSILNENREISFKGINNLNNLTHLILWNVTGITQISNDIFDLKQLEELNLVGNYSSHINNEFDKLSNLKSLVLDSFQNSVIPSSIYECKNLESLYISGNNFSNIPNEFSKLTKLKNIRFTGTNILTIPDNLGYHKNLHTFILNKTKVKNIDNILKNLTLSDVSNIEILDLSENGLEVIDFQDFSVKNIFMFDLSKNNLFDIRGKLVDSEIDLDLGNNNFSEIPIFFKENSGINYVNLSFNKITSLPDWIGQVKIGSISLKNNKISYFGTELCSDKYLNFLNLDGNPITDFNPMICDCEKDMLISVIGANEELAKKIRQFNNLDTDRVKIVTTQTEYNNYKVKIQSKKRFK